jgi:hypothetical protein
MKEERPVRLEDRRRASLPSDKCHGLPLSAGPARLPEPTAPDARRVEASQVEEEGRKGVRFAEMALTAVSCPGTPSTRGDGGSNATQYLWKQEFRGLVRVA